MTTLTVTPKVESSTGPVLSERPSVVLQGVPWTLYCQLRDLPDNNSKHMIFDRGTLVIMSPSPRHELLSTMLNVFILEWTYHIKLDLQSNGSTTFRREDLGQGLEPDACYYFQNEERVRSLDEIDLSIHPPPDLALEVDHTSPSDSKIPIYAAMGVPEAWIWKKQKLQALVLKDGQYEEAEASQQLPGFPLEEASHIMTERWETGHSAMRRDFLRLIGSER